MSLVINHPFFKEAEWELLRQKRMTPPELCRGGHTEIQIIGDEQICRTGNGRPKQL